MFGLTPYNRRSDGLQRRDREFMDIFDIPSLFDRFFNDGFFPSFYGFDNQIRVDIKEDDNAYKVEAELPGVDKDEISVELRDGRLTIGVERKEITNEERENYIRRERRLSSCSRTFYVDGVREEDVKAKFQNGILTIILPKADGEQRRKHRIQIE